MAIEISQNIFQNKDESSIGAVIKDLLELKDNFWHHFLYKISYKKNSNLIKFL